MQKISLKRRSVPGAVLALVSIIAAVVLSSRKAAGEKRLANGRVVQTANGINYTCAADATIGVACITDTASAGGDTFDDDLNGTDSFTRHQQTAVADTLAD